MRDCSERVRGMAFAFLSPCPGWCVVLHYCGEMLLVAHSARRCWSRVSDTQYTLNGVLARLKQSQCVMSASLLARSRKSFLVDPGKGDREGGLNDQVGESQPPLLVQSSSVGDREIMYVKITSSFRQSRRLHEVLCSETSPRRPPSQRL